MAIRRGTQTLGQPNVVPGAIILDNDTSNLTNTGRGTPSIVPEKKRQSQQWECVSNGETSNNGGHGITVLDISTINAAFQGLAYTFPNDGTTDDNSWTIDVALPTFMSATPNMVFRLFVQATGTGGCGGAITEVFTGAKVSNVSTTPQTINNNTNTQVTTTFDTVDYDTGVADFGTAYWDSTNHQFVIPTGGAGKFLIECSGQFDHFNGDGQMEIIVNGAQQDFDAIVMTSGWYNTLHCQTTMNLADGDTVLIKVLQVTGSNIQFGAVDSVCFFSIGRWDKPA